MKNRALINQSWQLTAFRDLNIFSILFLPLIHDPYLWPSPLKIDWASDCEWIDDTRKNICITAQNIIGTNVCWNYHTWVAWDCLTPYIHSRFFFLEVPKTWNPVHCTLEQGFSVATPDLHNIVSAEIWHVPTISGFQKLHYIYIVFTVFSSFIYLGVGLQCFVSC